MRSVWPLSKSHSRSVRVTMSPRRHGARRRHRHGDDPQPYGLRACGWFGRFQVPHPQRSVIRARDGPAAVGGDRHGRRPRPLAFEHAQQFGRSPGPRPAAFGPSERRDGPAAIGRHRHGMTAVAMGFERAQCLAALQVPEPAAFGHPKPRRHGAHRALPPPH